MPESAGENRKPTFEQVHRAYEVKIFDLILRIVGDRDDAEELTVETFLIAYRAWDQFPAEGRVSTWLHQIAVSNCKSRFRQRDRQRPLGEATPLSREAADWRKAQNALKNAANAATIGQAIVALPSEYREVLLLDRQENMPYAEIAQRMGLSVPAVKTRLHRARQAIRDFKPNGR